MGNNLEKHTQLPERTAPLERNGTRVIVEDLRDPQFPSHFDLERFLKDLDLLMDDTKLFRGDPAASAYGNYFRVGFAEHSNFSESIREAKVVRVTVENWNRMMAIEGGQNQTVVTVDVMVDEKHGKTTQLRFNEDGTYRSGSLTREVSAEEMLKGEQSRGRLSDTEQPRIEDKS
jgi:hypothetical protein